MLKTMSNWCCTCCSF